MSSGAEIAVVVVSFRTPELLRRCLAPLTAAPDLQIVVVDNASGDESPSMVIEEFPGVKLIENRCNLGFPAAVNQGVQATAADHVLVMNADVLLSAEAVRTMSAHLCANDDVGVVAPAQVDDAGRLLGTVHRDPSLARLAADQLLLADVWRYRLLRRGRPRGDRPQRIDWATGAVLLFRREALEAVGGFDDSVFMYGEEWDVQARIRAAGWSVELLPALRVRHDKGASATPTLGASRTALIQESWLHFHARHGGLTRLLAAAGLFSTGNVLRGGLRALIARDRAAAGPLLRALTVTASPWRLLLLAARRPREADVFGRRAPAAAQEGAQPLKLLTVDHATGAGGGQHSLLMLLARLPALGIRVGLVGPDGPVAAAARPLGGVRHVPQSLPRLRGGASGIVRWLLAVVRLARLVRRTRADVVHANTVRAAIVAIPAALLARRPAIWHCRDFWLSESAPRRKWPQRVVQLLLVRAATRTVAISSAIAAHLPSAAGVEVIANGIDVSATVLQAAAAGRIRTQLDISDDATLLLHAGRLRPWKGADVALEAVGPLLEADPSLVLVLAGGTPLGEDEAYAEQLRSMAEPFGRQVRLIGHTTQLPALMAASDLLLATGQPEPFGLVVAQAMAVGTPVVGFDHGALPELLGTGSAAPAGRVVAPGATGALRTAIATLLADDEARTALGAAASRRAARCYDVDRTARELSALLHDVATTPGAAAQPSTSA